MKNDFFEKRKIEKNRCFHMEKRSKSASGGGKEEHIIGGRKGTERDWKNMDKVNIMKTYVFTQER